MGLLGGLITGDAPSLVTVDLDPGTKKLIGDQYKHATQSDAQLAGEANQGVAQAGGMMNQTPQQMQQAAAGMGGGYSDAIRNQYNQVAGKNINSIVNTNNTNTSLRRAHMLQTAASSAMAQQRVETQNYEEQMKAMMQAEQSRAQVLSSVLGLAGVGVGLWGANGFKMPGGGQKAPGASADNLGSNDVHQQQASGSEF